MHTELSTCAKTGVRGEEPHPFRGDPSGLGRGGFPLWGCFRRGSAEHIGSRLGSRKISPCLGKVLEGFLVDGPAFVSQ